MAGRSARDQLGVDLEDPPVPEPVVEEPEVDERPEWLPEKFKDPSELAASYKELETELRARSETQKEMEARLDSLTTVVENFQQPQYQQQQQDPNQVNEQLQAAYENDPVGTMIFLANTAAQQQLQQYQQQMMPQAQQQEKLQGELIADNASRLLGQRYDDWAQYEQKVGEMISLNPRLLPQEVLQSLDQTTAQLDAIYKQAKYDDLMAQLAEAQTNGASQSQMKRQAQSLTGNAGRPPQPSEVDVKMDQLLAAAKGASWSAFRGGS